MDIQSFTYIGLAFALLSSSTMLVARNWRWLISALGLQYLAVYILVSGPWPIELAAVKLVAGWMAASILGMTWINNPSQGSGQVVTGRIFRLSTALLVIVTASSLAPQTAGFIPGIAIPHAWGGFLLIGMGLANLGFSTSGVRVILSLLTLLSGFEILYAAVETSTLVAGLLAVVTLGISLVGAYLLINFTEEPSI